MNVELTGLVFETDCSAGNLSGTIGTAVEEGVSSAQPKSGTIMPGSFSGTPKTAAVVFDTPFLDTAYAICISGVDARMFTYSAKTAEGFTINANANGALTGEVSWIAVALGGS